MSQESASQSGGLATEAVDSAAEIERLRAERDAAVAALDRAGRRARRRRLLRQIAAGVMVVLFAILLPVTVTATWAHRTVLNTDAYVETVTPIAADPAVTSALSRQITDQLYTALNPQQIIADALPPKAAFLAGPIANGARDSVQQAVNKVLSSDQFQTLWVQANRFAHQQLVTVLRKDSEVLQTSNGQVVLNLVPLLNEALKSASDFVSGVVGKTVTLPTITGNEVPSVACQKIATALDRPMPATCGQIALFPAKNLETARTAVKTFDRAVLGLLIVLPLLFAAALLVSHRRRRTLLQLTVGGMLGLVVVRRALMWEQGQLVDAARPENREARSAIVHGVLSGFFDLTWWLLLAGLVVVVVALVTGPYKWATSLRRGIAGGASKGAHLVRVSATGAVTRPQDDHTVAWVRRHFDALRVGGVIVAILLLLLLNVNFWGFLVVVVLAAVYEVLLHRLRPPETVALPPTPPTPSPPTPPTPSPPTPPTTA